MNLLDKTKPLSDHFRERNRLAYSTERKSTQIIQLRAEFEAETECSEGQNPFCRPALKNIGVAPLFYDSQLGI